MSSSQPPYGAPQGPGYGAPPPAYAVYRKPVPKRRRPSGWWFVVSSLLIVAGLATGVLMIVQAFVGFFSVDATIRADGQTRQITVETDRDRMIWIDQVDLPSCRITDAATGDEVTYEGLGNTTYTKWGGDREWQGDGTFDPGSGDLEVTCAQDGGPIQIGPAPEFGALVGGLAAGILIPLLLGGAGIVMLIVVGVLYATGRPRNVPAPQ